MAGMKSIVDRGKRAGILPKSSDRHCSFLPMAHLYERVVLLLILTHWYQVICCLTPDILFEYYGFVKPTRIFMVPRILNKRYDKIVGEVEKSQVKRFLVEQTVRNEESSFLSHIIFRYI